MSNPKQIGEILKKARKEKGFSEEKVCKLTRMQKDVLHALEDGTADDILSRVYVILFLKKYANILGLDKEELVSDYKTTYKTEEKQLISLSEESVVTKNSELIPDFMRFAKPALVVIGVIVLLFSLLFLFGKAVCALKNRPRKVLVTEQKKSRVVSQDIKEKAPFPIPKGAAIELVLLAREDAWMKMKKDGKRVFEGILKKGERGGWSAHEKFTLWVGRAEALDFVVNGKHLGSIGRGRIKSIVITRNGLKIGNKWLIHSD